VIRIRILTNCGINAMARFTQLLRLIAAALLAGSALTAHAQDRVLNLYSARHYQTDEALYANFTKATGIKINRIDADDAGVITRLKAEGAASPADVVLLVDAARLTKAEAEGMFQPVNSAVLQQRIPAYLRDGNDGGGPEWFGFSTRARIVVYNKAMVQPGDVDSYQKLADPKLKGKVCTRSGSHPYNLTLFGAMQQHLGPQATEAWLKGVVDNMARAPKGGDTDQIRAAASGECAVVLTNSYYLARLMRSTKPEDVEVVQKVGYVFPNQQGFGTHVNISGAAVAKHAKNRAEAVAFLEYLASDDAQRYFADGNNEWPAVASVKINNPALEAMGKFKVDTLPIGDAGKNQAQVQQMLDRVGYK
jgi:iron(III) transport system substrate-binding protein